MVIILFITMVLLDGKRSISDLRLLREGHNSIGVLNQKRIQRPGLRITDSRLIL